MSSLALTSGWYYICTSYCTSDNECKKHFKNNLYFYCSIKDYKLDFYSKKL